MSLLKKTRKNIVAIRYGEYNKEIIKKLANDSKFIIYFSFYDTGAIGLKEIQNYGVITFSLQKDLVIDNKTCFYIPELENLDNMEAASNRIIKIIKKISEINPNSQSISYILSLFILLANLLFGEKHIILMMGFHYHHCPNY